MMSVFIMSINQKPAQSYTGNWMSGLYYSLVLSTGWLRILILQKVQCRWLIMYGFKS